MKSIYVTVENKAGIWGSYLICFMVSAENDVYDHDVIEELRFAAVQVQEDLEIADKLVEENDLMEMILNAAADKLGATWHYVSHSPFTYEIPNIL